MRGLLHETALLLLLLLHAAGRRAEVVQDNIALPQGAAHRFVLPAPGLRHRPRLTPTPPRPPINNHISGNSLQQGGGDGGADGLPLGRGEGVARVLGLDVACAPRALDVTVTFDKVFSGIIYAKGYYNVPECVYVSPGRGGGGELEVNFEVAGGRCGAQYVEPPDGPPYLESVVVIQNEPGIQEVWDSARGVRCVFEEGLSGRAGAGSQRVSAALNVDLLDQQMTSFSARTTASATLDVQIGRGPFARSASGMVKIGELMTMVVGVEGPATTDLQVRECVAHDGAGHHPYPLTDQDGCVLGNRRKVLGSWQKTRDTGNPGVPVMAYAHFQAFKFPDENDVYLECEVDLCVDSCPVCPEDQETREKRALPSSAGQSEEEEEEAGGGGKRSNRVAEGRARGEGEGMRLARRLRVISPEDFSLVKDTPITLITKGSGVEAGEGDMCLSVASFAAGLVAVLVVLVLSSTLTAVLCLRVRTIPSTASTFPPDSSFHAFSTVSGKTR